MNSLYTALNLQDPLIVFLNDASIVSDDEIKVFWNNLHNVKSVSDAKIRKIK